MGSENGFWSCSRSFWWVVRLPPEQISIESRIEQLLERLSQTEACGFDEHNADEQPDSRSSAGGIECGKHAPRAPKEHDCSVHAKLVP